MQARVERSQTRLERACKTARGVGVAYDARASQLDACDKSVRVRSDDHRDVLEARCVRRIDDVLDERSTVERREQLLGSEPASLAGREDQATDLRRIGLSARPQETPRRD